MTRSRREGEGDRLNKVRGEREGQGQFCTHMHEHICVHKHDAAEGKCMIRWMKIMAELLQVIDFFFFLL